MPTSERSMPARVAAIRRAIETRQDFSTLANRGEAEVFKYARSIGMRGGELVLQWQETFRLRQAQAARVEVDVYHGRHFAARRAETILTANDLDDWSNWADKPDAPDDDDGDEVAPCATCNGSGRDSAGNVCKVCNGSGKAPANDEEGDEDDDGEQEPEDD